MPDWLQLAGEEVLLALQQQAASAGEAGSGFLDCHQYHALGPGLSLAGGHPQAQFRRVALGPEAPPVAVWLVPASTLPDTTKHARQLRRYLCPATGQEWEFGDIICGPENCAIYCVPGLAIATALPEARLAEEQPGPGFPSNLVASERLSCSSSRADALLAILFKVGRAEAQTAIEFGFAFLNFKPLTSRTVKLKAGDQLVYRTKGRVELCSLEENSRSGRLWVEFKRFPA